MTIHGLILTLLTAGKCLAEVVVPRTILGNRITDLSTHVGTHDNYRSAPDVAVQDGIDLLDIVLVASVDGRLHALNRTSGQPIWSMDAFPGTAPATLGPLVRTQHVDIDPDLADDDSEHQELYVVEPQSGNIFVMSSPGSPLQRLPFSMPQLVDMSPFSFSGDEDRRVFVGKKETSLLLVELETGQVKATLNAECPWDPFQDLAEPAELDLDLDELEEDASLKRVSKPTEVYIGRTDYHVSIYTRPPRPSAVRPPIQNLSFSVYGPNNEDLVVQSLYRHTPDDYYIQPLPTGEVFFLKPNKNEVTGSEVSANPELRWGRPFSTPIVAAFDVLKAQNRPHPFVLLQPRLHLEDIFPNANLQNAAAHNMLPNIDSTFVGMVEETGSLFAMSPDNFPFVVFGDGGARLLDAGPEDRYHDPERDLPGDLDAVTRRAKERRLRKMCKDGSTDRRCLTGMRKMTSSSQSRFGRLLDGAPSVLPPPGGKGKSSEDDGLGNATTGGIPGPTSPPLRWEPPESASSPVDSNGQLDRPRYMQALSAFALCALALLGAIVWLAIKKSGGIAMEYVPVAQELQQAEDKTEFSMASALDIVSETGAMKADSEATAPTRSPTPAPTNTHMSPQKRVTIAVDAEPEEQSPPPAASDNQDDTGDGDDSDRDGDTQATPGKRKGTRRKRGKKKKIGAPNTGIGEDAGTESEEANAKKSEGDSPAGDMNGNASNAVHVVSPSAIVVPPPATPTPVVPSLVVSDTVLGFGSHGTVVFKGSLQGRAVAVKRLLQDFVTLASREVNILQESDDHPNVIRYYYQEAQANFLYIALELCPASLADIIERPDNFNEIVLVFDPKRALRQVTAGLRHLHALKIIHRDIKPQNILISHAKKGVGENAGHRMMISDFGLCKKLEIDQTSFLPTANGAMAAGTAGWRAPEILRGEVKLDDSGTDESQSSRGSVGSSSVGTPTGKPTRLTKSVDVFALGCLYYYVLTNGAHPFGERYEREVNILKNAKCLDGLEKFGEEGSEGADLITRMLHPEAYERPDTSSCLLHPYFWDPGRRLSFLQDASDRFEIMCRDPRDPHLVLLETGAAAVVGTDWHSRLDKLFIENLGKFRKYDGQSVQDLLRALRNKKHHYQDLPDNVKRLLGSMPEGFLAYFTRRFPLLFLHVHSVVSGSSLRNESMFRTYFELTD